MKFKKKLLSVAIVTAMSLSMMCFDANALSDKINLHQAQGAPSSDVQMSQSWSFTTKKTTTTMKLTSYTSSKSSAYVYLYSSTGCSSMKQGTGSVTATNVKTGITAYASAQFNNYDSKTYYAYGTITG